jgi:hypothetical protein
MRPGRSKAGSLFFIDGRRPQNYTTNDQASSAARTAYSAPSSALTVLVALLALCADLSAEAEEEDPIFPTNQEGTHPLSPFCLMLYDQCAYRLLNNERSDQHRRSRSIPNSAEVNSQYSQQLILLQCQLVLPLGIVIHESYPLE